MTPSSGRLAHRQIHGVRAPESASQPWTTSFPVCKALPHHHIAHLGLHRAGATLPIAHNHQPAAWFIACVKGHGRVSLNGRSLVLSKNSACLVPSHDLSALEIVGRNPWEFCWVCYQVSSDADPISGMTAPVMGQYDPSPLCSAILGLFRECSVSNHPVFVQEWTDLIQAYVLRFVQPARESGQLGALWARLTTRLADHWTLAQLSHEAGYSREHLRRLCQRQLGRSPMHQLTWLRMRRAAHLLTTTAKTIQAVAREVGYNNPFVFSNTFTRWVGCRPSQYRLNGQDLRAG